MALANTTTQTRLEIFDQDSEALIHRVVDRPGHHFFFLFNYSGQLNVELTAVDASAQIFGVYIGKDKEQFTLNTVQHHRAPQTTSEMYVKGVFRDSSRFAHQGLIYVDSKAQNSTSRQTMRNLLLSDKAIVESRPDLEILADDVQCNHASTVGPANAEQLHYLQTRGIGREQALNMLAKGFLEDVFYRMDEAQVGEAVAACVILSEAAIATESKE